jgi:hypothetical protein
MSSETHTVHRTFRVFKHEFLHLFIFWGKILAWIRIQILNLNPDQLTQLNPDQKHGQKQ